MSIHGVGETRKNNSVSLPWGVIESFSCSQCRNAASEPPPEEQCLEQGLMQKSMNELLQCGYCLLFHTLQSFCWGCLLSAIDIKQTHAGPNPEVGILSNWAFTVLFWCSVRMGLPFRKSWLLEIWEPLPLWLPASSLHQNFSALRFYNFLLASPLKSGF